MIDFFILINLNQQADISIVARQLTEFDEVDNIHTLDESKWDIILKAKVKDMNQLNAFNLKKLRRADGISNTHTLIVAGENI